MLKAMAFVSHHDTAESYSKLAESYLGDGMPGEAVAALEQAIDREPHQHENYTFRPDF